MASYEKRGNSYRIKASCGYNAQGKQVFQRITWTPPEGMTEKQIEKELNRQCVLFDEECKKGFVVSPIKFETFAEQWFEEYANHNLRSTTLTRSRQLTKRTYEAIGHIRLDKLNARVIQRFINSLTAEGTNQNTGKGLAKKTIIHYLSFISTVLDYAIKMDMLSTNPCRKVTIPKADVKERKVYTIEETERFFELLRKAPLKYRVFFTLVIYTGMRRGEMLGLEWTTSILKRELFIFSAPPTTQRQEVFILTIPKPKAPTVILKCRKIFLICLKAIVRYRQMNFLKSVISIRKPTGCLQNGTDDL